MQVEEKFIVKELNMDKYWGRAPSFQGELSYTTFSSVRNATHFDSFEEAKLFAISVSSFMSLNTIITIYRREDCIV